MRFGGLWSLLLRQLLLELLMSFPFLNSSIGAQIYGFAFCNSPLCVVASHSSVRETYDQDCSMWTSLALEQCLVSIQLLHNPSPQVYPQFQIKHFQPHLVYFLRLLLKCHIKLHSYIYPLCQQPSWRLPQSSSEQTQLHNSLRRPTSRS